MESREKYRNEVLRLNDLIAEMVEKTVVQLRAGLQAVVDADATALTRIKESDREIDSLQMLVEDTGTKLIAMEQPVAQDLREIVSTIKIVSSIERIADHAKHLAKGAVRVGERGRTEFVPRLAAMAEKGIHMLEQAVIAYRHSDAELAREVAGLDEEIDAIKGELTAAIMDFMKADPEHVEEGASLLFLTRFMERMGDHVTTLCEWVYFTKTGEHIELN